MKSYEHYVYKLKQMTIGGLDNKRMTDLTNEIDNTQGKFNEGSKHFKQSVDTFQDKLVHAYKNKDFPEHDEEYVQRSMNDEINYNEDAQMEMI